MARAAVPGGTRGPVATATITRTSTEVTTASAATTRPAETPAAGAARLGRWPGPGCRANLRLGAPGATDAQIADLLADLQLGPWLSQLDSGLDTVLAPWGHPVAAGELQRLSEARAVLADRPVLLLDEPTSHLDAPTAEAVLAAILERSAGRCVLWVTHRPEELALFPAERSCHAPGGGQRRGVPETVVVVLGEVGPLEQRVILPGGQGGRPQKH
jgi:ATP-binding cassette subfamily C protein CydCD